MQCPNTGCNRPIADDSVYCPFCGRAVGARPGPRDEKRRGMAIVAGVVLMGVYLLFHLIALLDGLAVLDGTLVGMQLFMIGLLVVAMKYLWGRATIGGLLAVVYAIISILAGFAAYAMDPGVSAVYVVVLEAVTSLLLIGAVAASWNQLD